MNQKHALKPSGQFSVLLFIPRRAVGQTLLELRPHQPGRPYEPFLDNSCIISPHIAHAVTYLAARPCNHEHSEEILLKYFSRLLNNFIRFYNQPPVHIILYTFLMPCKKCTDHICQTVRISAGIPLVVAYSTGETFPGADFEYMTSMFRKNGILSVKEHCFCTPEEMDLSLYSDLCRAFNPRNVRSSRYCGTRIFTNSALQKKRKKKLA